MRLLLASGNRKKHGELAALLAALPIEVLLPDDLGGIPAVEEDGETFEENAAKKAVSAARAHRIWTLADDSGLEVEALDGAPGVRSARFAGEGADEDANNERLLRELEGLPPESRRARFACALAVADPDGEIQIEIRGTSSGTILAAPRGTSGFGYDPLFLFDEPGEPGNGRTFAELSGPQKSAVSHRGRALRGLADRLVEVVRAGVRA